MLKNPKLWGSMLSIFAILLVFFPHYYFLHRIAELKKEIEILENNIAKNHPSQHSNSFEKIVANVSLQQKLLSDLLACIAKSQIMVTRISEQKSRIILVGESPQFLQLKNFLLKTQQNHLHFVIKKMEMTDLLHFELLMDNNNG